MDDLGRAMTEQPDMLMLGGGNPAGFRQFKRFGEAECNRCWKTVSRSIGCSAITIRPRAIQSLSDPWLRS